MRAILITTAILLTVVPLGAWATEPVVDPLQASSLTLSLAAGHGWGQTSQNGLGAYDDYSLVPRPYDRESGRTLQLGVDYRLLDTLAAGVEVTTWSRLADEDLATAHLDITLAAVVVSWYPWRDDLFMRLGYGLGIARLKYLERGIADTKQDIGGCYLLAVGYDISLGGPISLTPRIANAGFDTKDLEVWASLTTFTLAINIELLE